MAVTNEPGPCRTCPWGSKGIFPDCAACQEKLEARDKAVALRVLIDIRDAANAELKGKGLSMSPAEAIANAWHAAFDKYEETAATLTDLQGLDPYE